MFSTCGQFESRKTNGVLLFSFKLKTQIPSHEALIV